MLAHCDLIYKEEEKRIIEGLQTIKKELDEDRFPFNASMEDINSNFAGNLDDEKFEKLVTKINSERKKLIASKVDSNSPQIQSIDDLFGKIMKTDKGQQLQRKIKERVAKGKGQKQKETGIVKINLNNVLRGEREAFLDEKFTKSLPKIIDKLFADLKKYREGLWTPEILNYQEQLLPGSFIEIYNQLNSLIPRIFSKKDVSYTGGKEILCEEYVPYLLSKGVRVIIIIRDPRDVIVSLNFREKDNLTGKKRPILYSLRLWRKSVAFALECENDSNFMWLKYEDLIENPIKILNKITSFLNIDVFDPNILEDGIRRGIPKNSDAFIPSHEFETEIIYRLGITSKKLNDIIDDLIAYGEKIQEYRQKKGELPRSYLHKLGLFLEFWTNLGDTQYSKLELMNRKVKIRE